MFNKDVTNVTNMFNKLFFKYPEENVSNSLVLPVQNLVLRCCGWLPGEQHIPNPSLTAAVEKGLLHFDWIVVD